MNNKNVLIFTLIIIFTILNKFKFKFYNKNNNVYVYFKFNNIFYLHLQIIFILSLNYHENRFKFCINKLIKNKIITNNIIDCGAYIGDNSISWSKVIDKNMKVYAIEPSKFYINFINKMVHDNNIKNLIVINKIISNKIEYYSKDSNNIIYGGYSYLNKISNKKSNKKSTTFDELYKNKVIDNIGFIHLDVEKMELKVLQGSVKIIEIFRPIISVEVLDEKSLDNLYKFFQKIKYEMYLVDENCAISSKKICRNLICFPYEKNKFIEKNKKIKFFNRYFYKI